MLNVGVAFLWWVVRDSVYTVAQADSLHVHGTTVCRATSFERE